MSLEVLCAGPVELIARRAGVRSVLLAVDGRAEERRALDMYRVARDVMVGYVLLTNEGVNLGN